VAVLLCTAVEVQFRWPARQDRWPRPYVHPAKIHAVEKHAPTNIQRQL
jgi:hypothetical protein